MPLAARRSLRHSGDVASIDARDMSLAATWARCTISPTSSIVILVEGSGASIPPVKACERAARLLHVAEQNRAVRLCAWNSLPHTSQRLITESSPGGAVTMTAMFAPA